MLSQPEVDIRLVLEWVRQREIITLAVLGISHRREIPASHGRDIARFELRGIVFDSVGVGGCEVVAFAVSGVAKLEVPAASWDLGNSSALDG